MNLHAPLIIDIAGLSLTKLDRERLKHPLVGDSVYLNGPQKCVMQLRDILTKFPRQALHATRLALEHPVTGEMMEWHVPMPEDMLLLLKNIRSALDEPESD